MSLIQISIIKTKNTKIKKFYIPYNDVSASLIEELEKNNNKTLINIDVDVLQILNKYINKPTELNGVHISNCFSFILNI